MVHSSSWSKLLGLQAKAVPASEYLATLLALRPAEVRLALARILQQARANAKTQLAALGIHSSMSDVLIALSLTDPSLTTLPAILDGSIDEAVRSKLGTALRLETAEPLTASTQAEILGSLRVRFPEPMVIDVSINPALVGGGRIQIGSVRIDVSTKTQLTRLRHVVQS